MEHEGHIRLSVDRRVEFSFSKGYAVLNDNVVTIGIYGTFNLYRGNWSVIATLPKEFWPTKGLYFFMESNSTIGRGLCI